MTALPPQEWEPALRLCRYVKSEMLWACLAAMAVAGKELHTAEVAYAAIEHVDKLLYMCHIKELPTVEAREAELLLFRRRQAEAVAVLVQGGWVYRAIKARHVSLSTRHVPPPARHVPSPGAGVHPRVRVGEGVRPRAQAQHPPRHRALLPTEAPRAAR